MSASDFSDAEPRRVSDLAQAVVDGSIERERDSKPADVLLPDELLPGTRETRTSLREGLKTAGTRTFATLFVIVALDNLQGSGLAVLAPNIRASLHVSSGLIVFVTGISGGFLVLGIVPMGWLADRVRRGPIVGFATFIFGLMVFVTGRRAEHLLVLPGPIRCRHLPVEHPDRSPSLLADTYPIRPARADQRGDGRGDRHRRSDQSRVWSERSPRWSVVPTAGAGRSMPLAIPIVVVSVLSLRLREPPRGQFEKLDVLGEVIDDTQPIPPSLEAAFERITRIRTIKTCLVAFSAIGFGLFTGPVLGNLFLKQHFHLDAFRRGLIGTIGAIGVLVALPHVGRYYDRLYQQDPAKALCAHRQGHPAGRCADADSVLHAEPGALRRVQRSERGTPPDLVLDDHVRSFNPSPLIGCAG